VRMTQEARARLEQLCHARSIATRRWYQPLLHQHAAKVAPTTKMSVPVAESVASGLIGLPFSSFMTQDDITRVAEAVGLATANTHIQSSLTLDSHHE
ncbi:MAG TPA: DegT/DnrJ/EryC1/StrS family aminotransferase, partial [Oxalicibacterium sp.]